EHREKQDVRKDEHVGEHRPTRQKQLLDTALPRLQHRTGGTLLRHRRRTGRSRCHHCPFSNAEGRADRACPGRGNREDQPPRESRSLTSLSIGSRPCSSTSWIVGFNVSIISLDCG